MTTPTQIAERAARKHYSRVAPMSPERVNELAAIIQAACEESYRKGWNESTETAAKFIRQNPPESRAATTADADTKRLDWLLDWLGFNENVNDLPVRDWMDNQDARVAIDAAMKPADAGKCPECGATGGSHIRGCPIADAGQEHIDLERRERDKQEAWMAGQAAGESIAEKAKREGWEKPTGSLGQRILPDKPAATEPRKGHVLPHDWNKGLPVITHLTPPAAVQGADLRHAAQEALLAIGAWKISDAQKFYAEVGDDLRKQFIKAHDLLLAALSQRHGEDAETKCLLCCKPLYVGICDECLARINKRGDSERLRYGDSVRNMAKKWAADDRLWTTQETVESSLIGFAAELSWRRDSASKEGE